ncbi:MAG: response regulator [Maribacter sp.]
MELTVCMIDDDLVSQFASRYCIEQSNANCRIIKCDNAEEGLHLFADLLQGEKDVPDILFLDLVMQGMDGWEFLDTLKNMTDRPLRTDIYILSAFTNSKDRLRAKEHPMVQGYFDKPLSKDTVNRIFLAKIS